jgi:UDPglucose 6-dehydrogenase
MRITVFGAGYVGLVSALCFAEIGHRVVVVENNARKLERLRRGKTTIHEQLVPELLRRHLPKNICFTASADEGMEEFDAVFICVGTPASHRGSTDLSSVTEVVRGLAPYLRQHTVLVEKSTVPVGTCDSLRSLLMEQGVSDSLFSVACNPEFLREGTAVKDFLNPDRIVIGTDDVHAREMLREIYRPLVDGEYSPTTRMKGIGTLHRPVVIETSVRSAELMKHASNAFLAMKISFINAVANIAEATGCEIDEIAAGMGADPRIGPQFLNAGIGYGGACFPKDVDEFRRISERTGLCFDLLNEVQRINSGQRQRYIDKVQSALGGLKGRRLAVLGLSFKAGTDDVRCSPAIAIVKRLVETGARVTAYDPAAIENARVALRDHAIGYAATIDDAVEGADALLILTDWPEFSCLNLVKVRRLLAKPVVIDGRNLYSPEEMRAAGLTYLSIGRADVTGREPAASIRGERRASAAVAALGSTGTTPRWRRASRECLQTSDKSDIEV